MLELNGFLLKWPLLLCLSVGLLLHTIASQIPLGSKLSAFENKFWVSPNGDFAFGFFNRSEHPNQFRLGVRFNSKSIPIDQQTVVWVMGADLMVGNCSYFHLTEDGELVLYDSLKGVNVWTSKTSQFPVASAALYDNGNFVLLTEKKDVVWQSFDLPSDTLLPGQNFSAFHTLRAASQNYMSSYYSLFMNALGQLQLRWDSHFSYWTSRSPSGSNLTVFLTSDGALQIRDHKWEPIWLVFGEDHNDSVHYRYLRLDVDGNLRLYSWLETSQSWRPVWQAVENQCNVFATCGHHGICVYTESGSPACKCPFKLTNESIPRCFIPSPQQCNSSLNMLNYKHTLLYGMYQSDDLVSQISLHECKSLCLNDPLCTAATFANDGTARCFIKKTLYMSGYADPSLSSVSLVKMCSDPMAVNPNPVTSSPQLTPRKGSSKFSITCLIGAVSGTSLLFILVQLALVLFIYRRRSLMKKVALGYTGPNSNSLVVLSFSEIKDVTRNFEHPIGPTMFKGILPNNQLVAVKDMKTTIEERKYRVIVSKIGTIHHKNLVKLKGYCCELNHRLLIYEYTVNGSLDEYMEDSKLCKRLTWGKRVEICLSVSRAISYLHTGCREFISHGNLKCENVVLDENFEAKVSEFGLHRIASETSSSGASAEMDVEDFGKMVLTLISGCKGVGELSHWAYKEWAEGNALNVVDRRINGGVDSKRLDCVLRIAFWCLQMDERMRPSMREVVKVLEGTLSVDPPPLPFTSQRLPEEEELSEASSEPNSSRF
ncbi:S-receptor-like serine/threonine-protein kinase [Parasponia andersonii]|uniref:Receptor-like serine/threonine-protein kinase n=1 Tax=Parasponia andersonii TaxID=3476 RepID=A0A2P5BKD8_PARAD|nr:S-receptor-like serine/threonine-protein kinase [Parasponia andersonii]